MLKYFYLLECLSLNRTTNMLKYFYLLECEFKQNDKYVEIEDLTLVVISYEIYETSLWRVS